VEDQVADLAAHVRGLGHDLVTFVEDESPRMQASAEVTMGRYTAMPPFIQKAYWDHGMGGGPESAVSKPARIAPEQARHYLLVRYASLLPGVVSNDILEGYFSDECRPWVVQSLMAGMAPKTHSDYVDDPTPYRGVGDADESPEAERSPAYRLRGHEEFLSLMRFCRDERLIREAPLSIEGVVVEGDEAVVAILRPTPAGAILALIQFAGRPAVARVRLAEPVDTPAAQRAAAGCPHQREWTAREILRSVSETLPAAGGAISGGRALDVPLAPYGFRVMELTLNSGETPRTHKPG